MAKFSIGQKVKVIDDGKRYPTYYDWVSDNELRLSNDKLRRLWVKYLEGCNDCETNTLLTVVACGTHADDRNIVIYLCEDSFGNPVLISELGLTTVEEEKSLKWTDLKIGDVIKQKAYGYQLMVIGMDSSPDVSYHVYVASDWITDSELSDCWEKVE